MEMTPEEEFRQRRMKDMEEDHESRAFMGVIFGIPLFLFIAVKGLNRPLLSSVLYSLLLVFSVVIPMMASSFISGLKSKRKNPKSYRSRISRLEIADMMLIVVMGFAWYVMGAAIHDFSKYLASPDSGRLPTVLMTSGGTLVAGIALFFFRLKLRGLYGATEIMAGITVASYRVVSTADGGYLRPEFYLAILTAGVYLVVRGMDNMHQSMKASDEKRAAENKLIAESIAYSAPKKKQGE